MRIDCTGTSSAVAACEASHLLAPERLNGCELHLWDDAGSSARRGCVKSLRHFLLEVIPRDLESFGRPDPFRREGRERGRARGSVVRSRPLSNRLRPLFDEAILFVANQPSPELGRSLPE